MTAIRDIVLAEPLFDCHEHQRGYTAIEAERETLTYRAFVGYAEADVVTASGGTDTSTPEAFFRWWPSVRTTGYGQATERACREVLGLDFTLENVPAIDAAMQAFLHDQSPADVYATLLAKANIRWAVNDACWQCPTSLDTFTGANHPEGFGQALRYDGLIGMSTPEPVQALERALDRPIQRLADLDRALDDYSERARDAGKLVAFKCGMAYMGPLRFDHSSGAAAEPVFEDILQGRSVDRAPLTGYLFHRLVQRAREFALPVQIHTGYLASNWGSPAQGDPTPFIPVFQRYRDVRFDLFHAGWPYHDLMAAIGKAFPNVYLDLCWAWSMNPTAMERALDDWLSAVPHNKILGYGGDTGLPFAMVGYAAQARDSIARVLQSKLDRGDYDLATAERVARRVLHENARELYGM